MSSFLLREVTVKTGLSKKSFEEERDESDIQMCSRNLISWEDFYPNNLKTTYHSSWRSWNVGVPVLDDLISFERQRKLRECMQKGMMSKMKWMCDTKSPCIWGQKGKSCFETKMEKEGWSFCRESSLTLSKQNNEKVFPFIDSKFEANFKTRDKESHFRSHHFLHNLSFLFRSRNSWLTPCSVGNEVTHISEAAQRQEQHNFNSFAYIFTHTLVWSSSLYSISNHSLLIWLDYRTTEFQ